MPLRVARAHALHPALLWSPAGICRRCGPSPFSRFLIQRRLRRRPYRSPFLLLRASRPLGSLDLIAFRTRISNIWRDNYDRPRRPESRRSAAAKFSRPADQPVQRNHSPSWAAAGVGPKSNCTRKWRIAFRISKFPASSFEWRPGNPLNPDNIAKATSFTVRRAACPSAA
jgi:hypothetical protein